jgi:hypothetical protein
MTLRSLSWIAVTLVASRQAGAEPPLAPETTDVADDKIEATLGNNDADARPARRDLRVAADDAGHVIGLIRAEDAGLVLYFGDAKHLWRQRATSSGATGEPPNERRLSVDFWEPRVAGKLSYERGAGFTLSCGGNKTTFQYVAADEAARVARSAAFYQPRAIPDPFGVWQDAAGRFYYIELHAGAEAKAFTGKPPVTETPILRDVDTALDSTVETKRGKLVITKRVPAHKKRKAIPESSVWISGGKPIPLARLEPDEVVYTKLGLYDDKNFATPCEVLGAGAAAKP